MKTLKHRTFSLRVFSPLAFAVISAIVVLGFIFTGCKNEVPDKKIAVKSVTLDPVELELTVGEEATLNATVLPKNASNKTVTWHSDKQNVATVTNGVVKAVGRGEATITVTTKNGKKATCAVTVNLSPDSRIAVTGVVLTPTELKLEVGYTGLLKATVLPENATNTKVTWISSDPKKATVADGSDPDVPAGTVKAVAEGKTTITVTTEDGNKTDTCEVTVKPRNPSETPVTGVTLAPTSLNLTVGGATGTLTATVLPGNATDKTVRWTINPEGFATVAGNVDTGVATVTAVKAGTATITVTTEDGGKTAQCTVAVEAGTVAVTGVTLDKTILYLTRGDTETLTPIFTPADATNKNVTWESSNTQRVTVSDTGVVTARNISGYTAYTITVRTADGNFTATCTVYVVIPVTGVSLSETSADSLLIGYDFHLVATVEQENATIKTVTWESSDENVVKIITPIDGNNNVCAVVGVSEGNATVTVTTDQGGKTATCAVTVVYIPVADVTLSPTAITLAPGSITHLIAGVLPEYASDKTVTWSTDKPAIATVAPVGTEWPDCLTGRVAANAYTTLGGTATITVTSNDNPAKTATCVVTVVPPYDVTSLALNRNNIVLAKTDAETLTLIFTPANARYKDVTWETSAPGVASVVNGKVTAGNTAGTATITVTTNNNPAVKATCAVTVVNTAPAVPGFVWINNGTFVMGSPSDEEGNRGAGAAGYWEYNHQVTLTRGFYMGETEVTQAQYEAVLPFLNRSNFPRYGDQFADRKGEFPVENVNWHEAILYCNMLSMAEGLSPVYSIYKADAPNADALEFNTNNNPWTVRNWTDIPANWSTNPTDWGAIPYADNGVSRRWTLARMVPGADGYRLPTEAEWEYACRADGNPKTAYNTGATITTGDANFGKGANGQTVPVKQYAPNAWGLYDMHGNVGEWCWDWGMNGYPDEELDPIPGLNTFSRNAKRIRGGAYAFPATSARSAARELLTPYNYVYTYGFRVVRYIKQD